MKRLLQAALVIPLSLLVIVVVKAGPSSAGASSSCGTGTISGTGCACPSSPYLSVSQRLYGVAGSSSSDVWAVGLQPPDSLIMHWDGTCWTVAYNQPVGYLRDTSAVSASDAWAVGGTSWWNPSHTLALHWNGSSWTVVTTPNQGGSAIFNGVAATSASNAWAVGSIGPGPGVTTSAEEPLIEHWDGSAWTAQTFAVPTDGGTLTAVSAVSATNAWAVGHTGGEGQGTGQTTLIEHWDGTSWTRVTSPNATGVTNEVNNVTIISTNDVWAVGVAQSSGVGHALTMHWNGSAWSIVSSPNVNGDSGLLGVSGAAANDVWAVGQANGSHCPGGSGPHCVTVAMHWNGSSWTVVSTPNPSGYYLNNLFDVLEFSANNVWAVGTTDYNHTLIEHWDGSNWRN